MGCVVSQSGEVQVEVNWCRVVIGCVEMVEVLLVQVEVEVNWCHRHLGQDQLEPLQQ